MTAFSSSLELAEKPMDEVKTSPEKPIQGLKRIAAESVEDTLKTFPGRIPVDASA